MDSVCLTFKTSELEASRGPRCEQVLRHFTLPPYKLLCFFDDDNPQQFDSDIGASYCGVHAPIIGSGLDWPSYVDSLFFDKTGEFAFQNVIYINGRTCSSVPGTVITLAHELQHFVQYGFLRKLWRTNSLIYSILRDGPPTTTRSWDLPLEIDSTAISKRVAELVLTKDVVEAHTEAQIAIGNDPEKWRFFRTLSTLHQTEHFLLAETKTWADKFMPELRAIKQRDVDFLQSEWWR
jgi:hypothetical protein